MIKQAQLQYSLQCFKLTIGPILRDTVTRHSDGGGRRRTLAS